MSRAGVHHSWQKHGPQPRRGDTFKFSADPDFDGKLTDVVGLYLDPPERALVLCVNEKQCPEAVEGFEIQAPNRTQPTPPTRRPELA